MYDDISSILSSFSYWPKFYIFFRIITNISEVSDKKVAVMTKKIILSSIAVNDLQSFVVVVIVIY